MRRKRSSGFSRGEEDLNVFIALKLKSRSAIANGSSPKLFKYFVSGLTVELLFIIKLLLLIDDDDVGDKYISR